MPKIMVTIRTPQAAPTISEIMTRYGLIESEIDKKFGVIEIDPDQHAYTILVDEAAAGKIASAGDWTVEGVFSNPAIAAFGRPQ